MGHTEPDPSPVPDGDPSAEPEGVPAPSSEPEPEPSGDKPDDGDLEAQVAKWKALARKHQQRAEKGLEAEKKLADLEDRDKTELQRSQESERSWQERAERAELQLARLTVGARKGLTPEQSQRLQGATEEELEADADELVAAFRLSDREPDDKQDTKPPPHGNGGSRQGTPVPKLKPGAVRDAEPVETDPAKLAASIPRRSF